MSAHESYFSVRNFRRFLEVFVPLAGTQLARGFSGFFGNFFLVNTGLNDEIAAMTIADTFSSVLLRPIAASIIEVAGVHYSKHFGAGKLGKLAAASQRTIGFLWVLFGLFGAVVYFAQSILELVGLTPQLSADAAYFIHLAFPVSILEILNQHTQVFVVSQDIHKPFQYFSTYLVLQSLVVTYSLISYGGLGGLGVIGARLIQEISNLIVYQTRKYARCDSLVLQWQSLRATLSRALVTLKKVSFSVAVAYGDYFAYYYGVILLAVAHDNLDITAWSSVGNVAKLLFYLSMGFANTHRSMVGQLMGERLPWSAKRQSVAIGVYNALLSLAVTLALVLLAAPISLIFTSDPEVASRIAMGLRVYGLFLPVHMQIHPLFTLFRLTNLDRFLMWTSGLVNPVIIVGVLSYLFLVAKWGLFGIFFGYGLCKTVILVVFLIRLYGLHDWGQDSGDEESESLVAESQGPPTSHR